MGVQMPALPLSSCVAWASSLTALDLSFLICKVRRVSHGAINAGDEAHSMHSLNTSCRYYCSWSSYTPVSYFQLGYCPQVTLSQQLTLHGR